MKDAKTIRALFTMSGFVASARLVGVFGDRYARIIKLKWRKNSAVFVLWTPVPVPGPL